MQYWISSIAQFGGYDIFCSGVFVDYLLVVRSIERPASQTPLANATVLVANCRLAVMEAKGAVIFDWCWNPPDS